MDIKRWHRYLFLAAGCWNAAGSLALLALSAAERKTLLIFVHEVPPSLFFFHAAMIASVVFGIGYLIVAKDPSSNRGIVQMGILVKLAFFSISVMYALLGQVKAPMAVLGVIDLLFAALFMRVLTVSRRLAAETARPQPP